MTLNEIADFIKTIGEGIAPCVWPLLVAMLVFNFRKQIRELLNRLQSTKLPGGFETTFSELRGTPEGRDVPPVQVDRSLVGQVKWSNSGNLYWLGHDLMWTIDAVVRGAARDGILYGLQQSIHHMQQLRLDGSPMGIRLIRLKSDVQKSLQQDWTPERRQSLVEELVSLRDEIGGLAQANQPDFKPFPD